VSTIIDHGQVEISVSVTWLLLLHCLKMVMMRSA